MPSNEQSHVVSVEKHRQDVPPLFFFFFFFVVVVFYLLLFELLCRQRSSRLFHSVVLITGVDNE
jgi:hypothetical protein